MAGKSAVQIMRWMGHKNLVTTNRYMHLSPATMEDMADVLAQVHRAPPPGRGLTSYLPPA